MNISYIFGFQSFKRFIKLIHSTNQSCFLFLTLDFQCGVVLFLLIVFLFFFQIGMLATLAIPEKDSKVGIFVIGSV